MATRRQAGMMRSQTTMSRQAYIYGNTVRHAMPEPKRQEELQPAKPKKTSRQVRKNRKKAMHMSAGYVLFLSLAAVLALVICVQYLQLQSRITSRSKEITSLQQQLAEVKEENTTRRNAVLDSVNLSDVRNKAVGEMGMVYASVDQIIEYKSPTNQYVKQYEAIPESGVIARSSKVTE